MRPLSRLVAHDVGPLILFAYFLGLALWLAQSHGGLESAMAVEAYRGPRHRSVGAVMAPFRRLDPDFLVRGGGRGLRHFLEIAS